MVNVEELLAKAKKPSADALALHPFYKGKLQVAPKCAIRNFDDFSIWYSPGVAAPCKDIQANPEKVFEHTNIGNLVAVITNGTRVLGLGDIGPHASLPVMEGKSILYKYLGGVDSIAIALNTKDPDKFIETCKILEPSFGGINLEDISQPACFKILDTLRKEMKIPVWHDDQQGTASVILAAFMNAMKVVGKDPKNVRIVLHGIGAANVATYRLLKAYGADLKQLIAVDTKGTLHKGRKDVEADKENFAVKWEICQLTNGDNVIGDAAAAMKGADIVISASKPGPGVIQPEWVKGMNPNKPVLFPCANPIPEIWPWEAKEAGAYIVGTGRSDFDNQVNNSLVFPGLFRGVLDIGASTVTDEMAIACAQAVAGVAEKNGLSPSYIVPKMNEWDVYPAGAVATAMKAQEQGIASLKKTPEELWKMAEVAIKGARGMTECLMKEGFIPAPPAV